MTAKIYTYVGGGESSPSAIKFMGKQNFLIGKATEVSDPEVLAKLKGHPCFVEGEADQDALVEKELEAKEEADKQREKDMATDKAIKERNKKKK